MKTIVIEGMTEGIGGKETYIINTFRAMDKKKYRFIFISYNDQIAYEQELVDNSAIIAHVTPRNKNPLVFWTDLDQLFANNRIDVVWAHKTTLSSCEILMLAAKHGVPVRMIHSHSSENMGGRFTRIMHDFNKKRLDRYATVRLACSDVAARWFYDDRSSIILKNAIDLNRYRFDPAVRERIRSKLGIRDQFVLGHVGRFGAEKNHQKLLHVFAALLQEKPDAYLILCGDGELRGQIEQTIHKLSITEHVKLLGNVSNVNEMLQAFDILIMPSLFEGLPFALLEAQASGLKCVVSDTVSSESNILGWNVAVPLNALDPEWVKAIQGLDLHYDRIDGYFGMKKNGFDLSDSIFVLERIMEGEKAL